MESGDVYLADVGNERRVHVVVLSNGEYNRRAGRVVVAPRLDGPPDAVPSPWRVTDGQQVYAVDFLLSLAASRLLEPVGRVSDPALRRIRQVLRRIT
ncbi:MAG: type II toxin-antitoxin system PemK/MazF family toxin [Acidimicrobiia bacterium]